MIGAMSKVFAQVIFVAIYLGVSPADIGAQDITACGVVNGDNAQKFVGGPLDVKEPAKCADRQRAGRLQFSLHLRRPRAWTWRKRSRRRACSISPCTS